MKPYYRDGWTTLYCGDAKDASFDVKANCVVTSPPYWGLRKYGGGGLGRESTLPEYIRNLSGILGIYYQVLQDDGTLWLNLGDCYARNPSKGVKFREGNTTYIQNRQSEEENRGMDIPFGLKPKDLCGVPWRVAFSLQSDGWWLRSDIIWHKPNCMPENVQDRPTKAHEYIFLFSKSERYYYDYEAIKEPCVCAGQVVSLGDKSFSKRQATGAGVKPSGNALEDECTVKETRNKRTVWTVTTKPFKGAHFATFSPDLIEPCILAGCPEGGIVLDPFAGSGTTLYTARMHNRKSIGIEINPEYCLIAAQRLAIQNKELS